MLFSHPERKDVIASDRVTLLAVHGSSRARHFITFKAHAVRFDAGGWKTCGGLARCHIDKRGI